MVLQYEPPPITVVTQPDPALAVVLPDPPPITVVTDGQGVVVAIEEPPEITVISDSPAVVVAVEQPDTVVLIAPGIQGASGTGTEGDDLDTAEIVATETIPALSLVTAGGKIADSNNPGHFNHVVGITMDLVSNGFVATCVVEGEVTDASWSWAPDVKLFLNGTTLSTIPVSAGFSQLIGISRNSNTVFIRLQVPIKL